MVGDPGPWAGPWAGIARLELGRGPRSRDRDRRHAAQRHRRDGRCRPARLPRRLAGRRARHAVTSQGLGLQVIAARASRSTVENVVGRAAAGLAVGHADGRPRSTPGSTSRPMTASTGPGRFAPGRPRAAPVPRRRLRRTPDQISSIVTVWLRVLQRPPVRQVRRGSPSPGTCGSTPARAAGRAPGPSAAAPAFTSSQPAR